MAPEMKHFAGVFSASFTPDGSQVVTGARDGSARLWNVVDGSPATAPLSIGSGLVRFEVSPCGRFIATCGGRAARLWDARSGESLGARMPHDNWVTQVRFSSDSRRLVTACDSGIARIWSIPKPDNRSAETLISLAHLVAGHRASPANGLVPLRPEELSDLLEQFREQ